MPAWKAVVISDAGQQVTSDVLDKSQTVPVRGTVRPVSLSPLLKCSPPWSKVKSQGARHGGALVLTPYCGTSLGLDACCTLTSLYCGRKVVYATWRKNQNTKKNHWVICAKGFRPELTQFSVELCFYTGQGHPMGWNAGTNDAVVLHITLGCATHKRFISKIHVTRSWFVCYLILSEYPFKAVDFKMISVLFGSALV